MIVAGRHTLSSQTYGGYTRSVLLNTAIRKYKCMDNKPPVKLVHILTVPHSLRFLEGQINYFQQNGYDIHAITSPGKLLDAFAEEQHIKAYGIEMPRKITPFNDLIAVWNIWRVLRAIKPDIVHSHTPKGGLLGTIAAWLARVPTRIYHARGLPFEGSTGNKRNLLKLTERISCGLAHRVFCNSQSNLDVIVDEGLCSVDKITLLHNGSSNGVDAINLFKPFDDDEVRNEIRAKLGLPLDSTVIGFVGRVVHDKGVDELIEAWKQVKDDYPNAYLLIVGRFEDQDVVLEQTREAIHNDRQICYASFFESKREMPKLYATMDIFTLPSHREGLPNVILEASAMGLPVISTFASGCKDAVRDSKTGVLVPVDNAHSIAQAIRLYLDSPELVKEHGRNGREFVLSDYRPEDIWQSQLNEYNCLFNSKELQSKQQK